MPNFSSLLSQVKTSIKETKVDEITAQPPQVLIDVREGDEHQEGFIPGALWIPRGKLELRIEDAVPDRGADIVLYCAGGNRSALAARTLGELGYTRVRSLAGGYGAWKRAGLPTDKPFIFTEAQKSRYARHIMLPEVGEKGQAKLLQAKVLLLSGREAPAVIEWLARAQVVLDDSGKGDLGEQVTVAIKAVRSGDEAKAQKTIDGLLAKLRGQ